MLVIRRFAAVRSSKSKKQFAFVIGGRTATRKQAVTKAESYAREHPKSGVAVVRIEFVKRLQKPS